MKLNNKAALLLLFMLAGCDSGGSDNVSVPSEPDPGPPPATGSAAFDNVWGPDINDQLDEPVFVYFDKQLTRQDMIDQFGRKQPENGHEIDPEDLRAKKLESYKKDDGIFIKSDIFNDNQITVADVLMYMSVTRDDFHVERQWSDEIASYRYRVSYDKNGDGDFDDEGDSKDDPNWYATILIDFAEFKREMFYEAAGEALYVRLENMRVQPYSGVQFRSYSPMMTKRREQVQKYQVELKNASKPSYYSQDTEVIVVREVELTPIREIGKPGGDKLIFKDVEARSHNLRPDVFKKDKAITMFDVLLSMKEQGLIDVGFSYWGELASGVNVQHFIVTELNGSRAAGAHGYITNTGVKWAMKDFDSKYILSAQVELGTVAMLKGRSTLPTYCDRNGQANPWDPTDATTGSADGILDTVPNNPFFREDCDPALTDITDWYADQEFHFFGDTWVMNYPGDYLFVNNFSMYDLYPVEESKRIAGDERWPVYDVSKAIRPLTQEHFGWGIANCGNCHSLSGIHARGDFAMELGVNPKPVDVWDENIQSYPVTDSSELAIAPYQCASCHGNNGAPDGHGEQGRCFWCHSEEFIPQNHGSVSKYVNRMYEGGNNPDITNRTYRVVDVETTDHEEVSELEAEIREFAPRVDLSVYPAKEGIAWEGYWGTYSDEMKVRTNSDWMTDPTYPDPYACVTCHVNR